MMSSRESNVCAGMVAGMIGGAVGTWLMSEFQGAWSRVVDGFQSPSAAGHDDARDWQERHEQGRNANEMAAQAVAEHTIHRRLSRDEAKVGALLVHYAFGATVGAIYGAMVDRSRHAGVASGAAYGTAVLIGGDKVAVPLLGLADRNADYSFEANLQAFASHMVFGVATEFVRRGVRQLM
jgi:hypothetical protein